MYAALGALFGFLVLHPYTMLAYYLHDSHGGAGRILDDLAASFKPEMLHMGLPYLLLGAVAGLFWGLWLEAARRRDEMEKKAYALETLKQLMVTLSHYLLNASTAIGGFAGLVIKKETDPDQVKRLEVIKAESERIEAIVSSIQSLKSIATENYGTDSETLMLDIKSRIEQHLEESKKELIDKNRAA